MLSPKHVFILAALGLLSLPACGAEAGKDGGKKDGEANADEEVDIFKDGAMQRISLKKLDIDLPKEQGKVMPGVPNADSIKGWYDTGHNYHAEKMGSKDIGAEKLNPANQRGIALKTGEVFVIRNGVAEAITFKDLEVKYKDVASKVSSPGDLVADSIKGWYDTGHNYHAEKMGGKDFGGIVVDPIAEKGVVIGQ